MHITLLQVFLLLFTAAFQLTAVECLRELVYVQAIWRHGDRAPTKYPYPNDKYTEQYWPRGWGHLTSTGMKQLYRLGHFFRQRYGNYIGSRYNVSEVRSSVMATSVDRATESAQAMLRGLFPMWQPVPFHSTTPGEPDPVSSDHNAKVGLAEVLRIHNLLHNMTQPDWLYKKWPNHNYDTTYEIVQKIKLRSRLNQFNSPTKAMLRGGLLAGHFLQRALNVSKGVRLSPSKMMLYSSHDVTIQPLLHALGINNDLLVPYAGCLIMEVYKTWAGKFEVEVCYHKLTF
ncbi:unnamed protein product [Anisakis simplex]|uniref:Lysosomal acid phosphatase n=1 Tax=Anisakis simplex TaxID=6269 RepID=A0A0M3IYD5_ANISI|nr:unnamed protein product [Anisakis simplex]